MVDDLLYISSRVIACFSMLIICLLSFSCNDEEQLPQIDKDGEYEFFEEFTGIRGITIYYFFEDKSKRMWIGTSAGAFVFDGTNLEQYTIASGISSNHVYTIEQDSQRRIWLGTSSGISILENNTWLTSFNGIVFNAIVEDSNGNVWLGTDGAGLIFQQASDKEFYQIFDNSCSACNRVNAILEDRDKSLWFGLVSGLKRLKNNKFDLFTTVNGLSSNFVLALFQDSWGSIWVGSKGATATRYRSNSFEQVSMDNGQAETWIFSFIEDTYRNLWISTGLDGLVRFDGALMKEVTIKNFNESLTAIGSDSQGNIWIGSRGKGIARYTPPLP